MQTRNKTIKELIQTRNLKTKKVRAKINLVGENRVENFNCYHEYDHNQFF